MYTEDCEILAVDLDGTLLRTDMLYESFFAALSHNWCTPLHSAKALISGPASLKRYLASAGVVDVSTLPYNEAVISYIIAWRRSGGRVVLVTASDQIIAEAIAEHLGIFDEVHGSNPKLNLKGENKASFLENHFGIKAFAYMGDSAVDLSVWKRAQAAITVQASYNLRRKTELACENVEHLSCNEKSFIPYVITLRPHQWLKNILVFLPILAAHRLEYYALTSSLLAFICFCMIASSVYILNDLLDLASDRAHPRKKFRPFACGKVPIVNGVLMASTLIGLGLAFSTFIGRYFFAMILMYFIITILYSFKLKRIVIIDVYILSLLYSIRICAGAAATLTPLSVWLLAFSIFFFLSLAAVKRQAELVDHATRGKQIPSGRGYHTDDLTIITMIAIGAGLMSVLVMMLYVQSPSVSLLYNRPDLLWGVSLVLLYWIINIIMVSHRGYMDDDPIVFAVKDRKSQVCLFIIVMFILASVIE